MFSAVARQFIVLSGTAATAATAAARSCSFGLRGRLFVDNVVVFGDRRLVSDRLLGDRFLFRDAVVEFFFVHQPDPLCVGLRCGGGFGGRRRCGGARRGPARREDGAAGGRAVVPGAGAAAAT